MLCGVGSARDDKVVPSHICGHPYERSNDQWHLSYRSMGTESVLRVPGSINVNGLSSPAQAVSSISTRQSRVTQFIPPLLPAPSISPAPGSSRSQSIQRMAVNRSHRGRHQYPQGPTLGRSGVPSPSLGLTVTVAIIPFKVGCWVKCFNMFS